MADLSEHRLIGGIRVGHLTPFLGLLLDTVSGDSRIGDGDSVWFKRELAKKERARCGDLARSLYRQRLTY